MNDEALSELVWQYKEGQRRGETPTPEQLCAGSPELLGPLRERLQALGRMEAFLDGGRPAETPTASEGPASRWPSTEDFGPLPRRLGPFELRAVLGAGGMGVVYRAFEEALARDVAVKVMRPEYASRPEARQRFLREARAAAAVHHDHVVPIHQVGEDDGVPYIAMPLLAGESLEKRLGRGRALPISEVVRIGMEAAEGLAAAHDKGLVHRDVKPANIWLEVPSGRLKLLDFGLARAAEGAAGGAVRLETLTQEGAICGTPGYMSPEQINSQAIDCRTDLFSLGCVLFRALTGRRAFGGDSPMSVLVATLEREPPAARSLNPEVPEWLSALVARLLAKRPDERPGSARQVAEALRSGTTVANTPPPETGRRRRWPVLVGGLAALLVLAGAGVAWLRPARDGTRTSKEGQVLKSAAAAEKPLTVALDVRVWKKDNASRGLTLGDAGALPLRPGDWMRVEARATRPAYLYVVYLDAKGEASPMFPWRKYDWTDRPEEKRRSSLDLPEDPRKDAAPLDAGPSGIESVLMLAREEPLSAEENASLAKALAGKPQAGRVDPLRGAVWLGGEEERFSVEADRSRPALEKAGEVADPVERLRRLLRHEVKGMSEARRGVCYPFEGK
jgi:serine/threonine protein kinase